MTRRHDASARRTWAVWVVVLAIVLAVPSFSPFDPFSLFRPQVVRSQGNPENFQLPCRVTVSFWNQKRRVTGPVSKECSRPHSVPFGNWGVNSNYGARWDGDQFSGWLLEDRKRQWNSCTTDKVKFPTGGPHHDKDYRYYYNDPIPARTKQKADPDDARAYAVQLWDTGHPFEPNRSCQDVLPPLLVYSGLYMHLYELDGPIDSDDLTAKLSYPTHHVPITCHSAWNCTGSSVEGWTPRDSSTGQATANIRVTLETRRLQ